MILTMNLPLESYDIIAQKGVLDSCEEYLNLNRKVMIVSDDGVPEIYYQKVAKKSLKPYTFVIKQGEQSKSLDSFKDIIEIMLENNFTRKDCVVAVGGGVVGDLAGFVAASYMRGIDFYNIPTTTLSQIDSSIGGKTAVNFGGYKNMVGAFYQPKKVLIDFNTLATLSRRQYNSGIVEAVKMAATCDEDLFKLCEEKNIDENIEEIIIGSLKIKKDVVEKDEKENGLRKILNFGHTIGHGIEVTSGTLYHGEAVGLGMLCMCGDTVKQRISKVLAKLDVISEISLPIEEVIKAVSHDKKSTNDMIETIYVENIGSFEIKKMDLESIKKATTAVVKEG